METLVDVVGLALVAKVTLAIVVQEILVEGFGEIGSLLNAGLLDYTQVSMEEVVKVYAHTLHISALAYSFYGILHYP